MSGEKLSIKEYSCSVLSIFLFSFPSAEKKQNAAAAPDAIKVSGLALTVPAAPAEAEKKS